MSCEVYVIVSFFGQCIKFHFFAKCSSTICGKDFPSSINIFFLHFQKINWAYLCMSVSEFSTWVPLISVSIPLAAPHSLVYCGCDYLVWDWIDSPYFFFFKNVLATLVALTLNINFRIILSISPKILLEFL